MVTKEVVKHEIDRLQDEYLEVVYKMIKGLEMPLADFENERSDALARRIKTTHPREIVVCSVVKAELFYGALKSARPAENLRKQQEFLRKFDSLPFDDRAAEEYGRIRSRLEKAGTPIGPNDLSIASIALAHDVTAVTRNLNDFKRVEGIKVEDWRA